MTRIGRAHAPPAPARPALAVLFALATLLALVACTNPGGGAGPTTAPGATMGTETTAPTSGY